MKKRILSFILAVNLVLSMVTIVYATENNSVTVYLSICDNGDFVNSPITSEKMAKVPIEISYFNLADYGMEAFCDGEVINEDSNPTLLHLFLKATETYYIGETYSKTDEEHKAIFDVGGSAGSASLNRFWNHDYNLSYKIDRANPETVDAPYLTCDKLVLEDGDVITVGMFTSQTWYIDGYYAYLKEDPTEACEDANISFEVMGRPIFGDGTTDVPLDSTKVFAVKTSNPDWIMDENPELIENISTEGKFEITFDTPGTYYVTILDLNTGLNTASIIPYRTQITINPAPALPQYLGDWTLFRKNVDNMGIVNIETPEKTDNAKLKWAKQHSADWQEAITSPIIVDNSLYIGKVNTVQKIDIETGEVITTSESLEGNIGYGTIPLTYGDGLVFVPVGSGKIQALRADTLESVWVSEALDGQILTPISYKDGKIYCGTWLDETADGKYFCIDVTDENKALNTETKACKWTVTHLGGFYGAGAYVGDGFSVFGSDNGTADNNGNAVLYSINTETGNEIARIEGITGDIRTAIAYDANTASVYFATKENILYKVILNADGSFGTIETITLGGMCTATPLVYDGIVYVGVASPDGAWAASGHKYLAIDAALSPMSTKAECSTPGYAQGSAILSTAFEQETGKLYLYTTYNNNPGGIYLIEIANLGDTLSLSGSDLYVPPAEMQNYCSSSLVCDSSGIIYYKNDSGYIMAIKREVPDVKKPSYSGGGGGSYNKKEEKEEEKADEKVPETESESEIEAETETESKTTATQFTDVKGHWAADYIGKLVEKGIIKGKSEAEFAPDDNITRAEFVTLLYRISGESADIYEGFTDVNKSDWYADAVYWARTAEITSGVSEKMFAPDDNITREQAATFIVRFANHINLSLENLQSTEEFVDVRSVSDWAQNAVKLMQSAGIIGGKGGNNFAPSESTTRAETAKMLTLVMEMAKLL